MGQFSTTSGWCTSYPGFSTYTVSNPSTMSCASCVVSGEYSITVPLPSDVSIEWFGFSWGHNIAVKEIMMSDDAEIRCDTE